ncbi:pyridoxal phosphate-dependent transferase [Syncephalis fuscata]|nr:pyridoxal phosphate-dependent transferase [Syncephalis fuscata]
MFPLNYRILHKTLRASVTTINGTHCSRLLTSPHFVPPQKTQGKVLSVDNINPNIRQVEYAVRGELAIRAEELNVAVSHGEQLPFSKVVNCNIGNPQQLNQKPITFFRQVAALTEFPDLLKIENRKRLDGLFPEDTFARAQAILDNIGSPSIGAYTHSQGIPYIRRNVAKFIEERDGYPSNPDNIFLTTGASSGVQTTLSFIVENPNVGVMIPIPQYPLYTATLSLVNGKAVPYYLEEEKDWGLDLNQLHTSLITARKAGTDVRALVIINPGNPTGQCLNEANMREIIDFCHREHLVLLADEVYQTNIYMPEQRPFHSFKKVLCSMGPEYSQQELFSFHSISKGMIGECGRRGGYFECTNIAPDVMAQIYKIASVSLCPNVQGQILVDLMVNPPKEGDTSYKQYSEEINEIYESLKRRSKRLASAFNTMEGVTCNDAQGAMYLFPRIRLPQRAVDAAQQAGKLADEFYALAMLNATGVCVVPDGTWHFRSTFLPEEHLFDEFIANLKQFHQQFLDKYRD